MQIEKNDTIIIKDFKTWGANTMTYLDFIARRVHELRSKTGITAREMSIELGQNPTYISQIEGKKALPSVPGLIAICTFFDMTPQDFFDEREGQHGILGSIIHEAATLDDSELFILREVARTFNRNKNMNILRLDEVSSDTEKDHDL